MFFIIFCIIGLIAGIGGLILYFNVNNLFGNTMNSLELHKAKIMMLILTFNLVISFIFSIYGCILNAYEKFVYQKVISILNTILRPIIMIPLLFLGYKSITMVVVITVLNILVLLSNYIYCRNKLNIRIKYRGFDKNLFKTILGYSIWLFLGSIVDKVNWSVDQFVLGAVSGTIAVSIYSVASSLNQLFLNLSTAISNVFLPKMAKLVAQKASADQLTDEMIKVGRIQYYILFLACSGLVLFGKEFIVLWVGSEFKDAYYVSLLLIIPLCFPLIQNLGLSIMQAMNKYRFKSISTAIMAFFNIIISIFLAKKYGAIGSAMGTAFALVICNVIIINIYYYKEIKLNIIKFWKSILSLTIFNVIPIILILIFKYFIRLYGVISILVYGTIYTLMYFIVSYFINMNDYEKSFIKELINKLKIRKVVVNDKRNVKKVTRI